MSKIQKRALESQKSHKSYYNHMFKRPRGKTETPSQGKSEEAGQKWRKSILTSSPTDHGYAGTRMNEPTRRAVAYIAARLVSGKTASAVYDYGVSRYFHFSGDVRAGTVNVYDHDQACHIGGTLPSLYHYGNKKHLNLEIKGSQFSGYDYDSGKHFSGSISGSAVSLYDYQTGRYYNFSI
jgi:hypothetical protein